MNFKHHYLGRDDVDRYYCELKTDENDMVGWCKYYKPSIESDDVCIEYILIKDEYRRKGYATQVVKELQKKYGGLTWDNRFTPEGKQWYASLIKNGVVSI